MCSPAPTAPSTPAFFDRGRIVRADDAHPDYDVRGGMDTGRGHVQRPRGVCRGGQRRCVLLPARRHCRLRPEHPDPARGGILRRALHQGRELRKRVVERGRVDVPRLLLPRRERPDFAHADPAWCVRSDRAGGRRDAVLLRDDAEREDEVHQGRQALREVHG